jgi:hypothetical protein
LFDVDSALASVIVVHHQQAETPEGVLDLL